MQLIAHFLSSPRAVTPDNLAILKITLPSSVLTLLQGLPSSVAYLEKFLISQISGFSPLLPAIPAITELSAL
jgi:hypothetical protein